MIVTAKLDTSRTDTALAKRSRGFKDNFREEMNDIGRLIAVSLATSAQPYGISAAALKKGEIAVARDIYRIYASPKMVYDQIALRDKDLARTFSKMLSTGYYFGAFDLIQQFAPKFSLVQIRAFDNGALHKARRNKRGRVPASQKHLMLVTNPGALYDYVRVEKERVGFGKAGWANCAKAFREGRAATRGLPGWITRHKTAPSNVAINETSDGKIIVTMQNNVSYAEQLLTSSDKAAAIGIGVDRVVKSAVKAEKKAARENPFP